MLSDEAQDEKSYRYAIINLGGNDWTDVYTRFEELKPHLRFEFKKIEEEEKRYEAPGKRT